MSSDGRNLRGKRLAVVSMILGAAVLPLIANLGTLHSVVWLFWLGSLVLIIGAIIVSADDLRRTHIQRRK